MVRGISSPEELDALIKLKIPESSPAFWEPEKCLFSVCITGICYSFNQPEMVEYPKTHKWYVLSDAQRLSFCYSIDRSGKGDIREAGKTSDFIFKKNNQSKAEWASTRSWKEGRYSEIHNSPCSQTYFCYPFH